MSEGSAFVRAREIAQADPDALIAVVGPTASGKTALAVDLAEALGGEIVSADSVQVYKGFDIGSGKPSAEELRRAPHHLVGVLDPLDAVDAAKFAEMADRAIDDIRARGRRPIVCGGTFLWVKALFFGLAEAPSASPEIRARHQEIALREGRPALHARLAAVDPETAARLHPNDFVRTSRALEVYELTQRPMSVWQAEHGFREARHRGTLLAVERTPEELTERIRVRVRGMLDAGWIDEVRGLIAAGYGEARAMGAVGYREVKAFLDGSLAEAELETAIVRVTRGFGRRQRTWLKGTEVTVLE